MKSLNKTFYLLKPCIPRRLQLLLRRQYIKLKKNKYRHMWPIDLSAGHPPPGWQGWPEKKQFAFVLSHDVDTQKGHDACRCLMDIDEANGFRSCFNIVPEKYKVSMELIAEIKKRGFEVGVHGLKHDGKLFFTKKIFMERAKKINCYFDKWGTRCFTSPSMHHNSEWMHHLNLTHSTSTFDSDPFEPQPDAAGTIFPFRVENLFPGKEYIELPYTLPQDFTLFILMQEKSIDIWKRKLDWIAEKGGMALLNTHPDYMSFNSSDGGGGSETYPVRFYAEFLEYIKERYRGEFWQALPRDVASFLRTQQTQQTQ